MAFAKWVFLISGIYGVIVTAPLYLLEGQMSQQFPPAINHSEYYFGFLGVTFAWQILFLVISRDPARYRPAMPVAILEKASYVGAMVVLVLQSRIAFFQASSGVMDLLWGVLFLIAYVKTGQKGSATTAA